jgi:putative DNA primase/helicase
MELTICTADCTGNAANCSYPHHLRITSAEEMAPAMRADHVCAEYTGDRRGKDSFLSSCTAVMDCDNDHSENPGDWITPERLGGMLPGVAFAAAPSRHDGLPKEGRGPRPRFHAYFQIAPVRDAGRYAALKASIQREYPFFDGNAIDAARFIFGSGRDGVYWHDGWICIDEIIAGGNGEAPAGRTIPEGRRNSTLSRFAGRVIKRFGISDRAHELFAGRAGQCDPPLEDTELDSIWASAARFFEKKVSSQEGYIAPDAYNADPGSLSLRPDDYSDIGQARVLAREYGGEMRYTDATDYLRFNGEFWAESRQHAIGAAEEFLDLQLADAAAEEESSLQALLDSGLGKSDVLAGGKGFAAGLGPEQSKLYARHLAAESYLRFVMKRRDMKYVVSALQAAKPMLFMDIKDFDADWFLLNAPGMTYDLRNGTEGGHAPAPGDLITKQTMVSAGEEGKEQWLEALDLFFCGDRELIDYVQKTVGLAAIGKVYVEALVIAYGEGRNGKSTFWNSIMRVLGTYSGTLSADALTIGCRRNVKPEMAELKGKRLIIASELEEGMRLNNSIVKQLCSTDEVQGEKKYKDPFHYTPSHTVILYTNHLPRVGGSDEGIWRRLIVIPFSARIEGRSDIKNYSDYLVSNSGPFIMKWIIEGARLAIESGYRFSRPKCVDDAVASYRSDNDWMGSFLYECCEVRQDLEQRSGELYQEYRNHCARNGEYTRSTTDFYAALDKLGLGRQKRKSGMWVQGVQLRCSDFLD